MAQVGGTHGAGVVHKDPSTPIAADCFCQAADGHRDATLIRPERHSARPSAVVPSGSTSSRSIHCEEVQARRRVSGAKARARMVVSVLPIQGIWERA